MLARRSIENYLTRHALTVWADAQASKADVLRGRIAILYGQWFDARPERRNHFRMKEGFQKMTPAHAIYREAPEDVRKQLQQGFGTQLSTAFTSDQPREVDLRDEGAWDELSEMIEALLRSMR